MDILKFKFANDPNIRFKTGRFEFDGLRVNGADDELEIEYDNIRCFLDDVLYTGGISTWAMNNVSVDFLFESVLNSYLRNNTEEYAEFDEGWNVFHQLKSKRVYEDGLLVKFPVYNYCLETYELDFATPRFRYYHNDSGDSLILDEDGKIITDVEAFVMSGLFEDIGNVLKGKERCIYGKEFMDDMIREYGEEEFLEAADD